MPSSIRHPAADRTGLLEEEPERFVLLTYTHTLVKFDRYLSSILKPGGQLTIQNIDAFLLERLHLIDPAYRMNYRRVSEAARQQPSISSEPKNWKLRSRRRSSAGL